MSISFPRRWWVLDTMQLSHVFAQRSPKTSVQALKMLLVMNSTVLTVLVIRECASFGATQFFVTPSISHFMSIRCTV